MNYQKVYDDLISQARTRGLDKSKLSFHTERHHIIPHCCGGTEDPENLILLTPKEHFVAHHLLFKLHPKNHSLFLAYRMMAIMDSAATNRQIYISASEYERIKIRQAEWRKDFVFTEDILQKMRKPRRFTNNMRKPKTATPARIAECEHKRITMAGKSNPLYGTHFEWYNDGQRNYRITENPPAGLVPGKLQKQIIHYVYVINDLEFYSEKEVYNYMKPNLTFSTWKRKNTDFIKSIKCKYEG